MMYSEQDIASETYEDAVLSDIDDTFNTNPNLKLPRNRMLQNTVKTTNLVESMHQRSVNDSTGQFITMELDELLDFVDRHETPMRQSTEMTGVRQITKPSIYYHVGR